MTTAPALDRLDLILAELRALRAEFAELRAGGHSEPANPICEGLAAISAVFRGRPVTCREIVDRAASLPTERLADPLRRGFRTIDPVVLGRRLGEVAASPVSGFTVEATCRERAGTVWTVRATDLV